MSETVVANVTLLKWLRVVLWRQS